MNFKSLKFTQKQVEAYTRVRETLRVRLAQLFGLDAEQLQRLGTQFCSEVDGFVREYWHSHIDTEQYGTFAYTSLLYLNTQDEDSLHAPHCQNHVEGESMAPEPRAVEPRGGRVVAFSSDAENPHKAQSGGQGEARQGERTGFRLGRQGFRDGGGFRTLGTLGRGRGTFGRIRRERKGCSMNEPGTFPKSCVDRLQRNRTLGDWRSPHSTRSVWKKAHLIPLSCCRETDGVRQEFRCHDTPPIQDGVGGFGT
ncbi:unnamed protein product [Durusdinium trenchii]|uniref:Uncharacterized protein n=1 Tax=Durusdinium trenchii TaxID=1381693 RepID=A0ABP0IYS4_9DINO